MQKKETPRLVLGERQVIVLGEEGPFVRTLTREEFAALEALPHPPRQAELPPGWSEWEW